MYSIKLADLFTAFHFCFRFLSHAFLTIPEEEFIADILKEDTLSEWPVAANNEALNSGVKVLRDFSRCWQPAHSKSLKLDYTRLFIGLEKTLAPPYASVYLSKERILFEKQMFEARRFYKRFNLQVKRKNQEPDDHIGYEFYFLSFLCQKTAQEVKTQNNQGLSVYQSTLKEFLSAHLLRWLDPFLSRVRANAETLYYRGLADLAEGTVQALSDCLHIARK
ncbi:MAG: molecular chaperone TorD family protein [Candidatus Aminicenantes bacterium]|jgi:TorA maturation chaperone TorD